MMRLRIVPCLLVPAAVALLAMASPLAAQRKNLLFYGNSYSAYHGSVADLVQFLAVAAGKPMPTVVKRLQGGANLAFHASDAGQVGAISTSLPAGQGWDYVVLQGQSLEATDTIGNPLQFRSQALAIMANVRAHSPAVKAVLYQTWARASGHVFYPGTYAAPLVMHEQIRANYQLSRSDLLTTHGADAARLAPVGDAVELLEWQDAYYAPDLTHPSPAMTLLASMCLYTSIYGERVCSIAPDQAGGSALAARLSALGLATADYYAMAGLADRVAAPEVRPFAGSSDQLLLESGVLPGPVTACGRQAITQGSVLMLRLASKNGVFDGYPAWIVIDAHVTGVPPMPSPAFPELHVNPGTMLTLIDHPGLATTSTTVIPIPFSIPGLSVLVQGVAFGPSSVTGNAFFATSDAHVLDFY